VSHRTVSRPFLNRYNWYVIHYFPSLARATTIRDDLAGADDLPQNLNDEHNNLQLLLTVTSLLVPAAACGVRSKRLFTFWGYATPK
jgi:hypothetical protein